MLEQAGQDITFYAFYVASKTGKTGLTPTVDVHGPGNTLLVTGGNATEIGNGWYYYTLAGASTGTAGGYKATFKTADSTVERQHEPSFWAIGVDWVENVDGAISSLPSASSIATAVWNAATRTLSSFGTLAADVWGYATRALTDKADFALNEDYTAAKTAASNTQVVAAVAPVKAQTDQLRFDEDGNVNATASADITADVAAIANLLASGSLTTTNSTVYRSSDIVLIQANTYGGTFGWALPQLSRTKASVPVNIAAATAYLRTAVQDIALTITSDTTNWYLTSAALTATQTAELIGQNYEVWVYSGSNQMRLGHGKIVVDPVLYPTPPE